MHDFNECKTCNNIILILHIEKKNTILMNIKEAYEKIKNKKIM